MLPDLFHPGKLSLFERAKDSSDTGFCSSQNDNMLNVCSTWLSVIDMTSIQALKQNDTPYQDAGVELLYR